MKILFYLIFVWAASAQEEEICGPNFVVESDLDQSDCGSNYFFLSGNENYECFPRCQELPPLIVECEAGACPPGYKCPDVPYPKCVVDEGG